MGTGSMYNHYTIMVMFIVLMPLLDTVFPKSFEENRIEICTIFNFR